MKLKRSLGILLIVVGIVLFVSAGLIRSQVAAGKEKLREGEEQVGQAQALFSLSPTLEQIGGGSVEKGKQEIAQGRRDIASYTRLAGWLQIGGILSFIGGVGLLIYAKIKKRN